MRGWSHETSTTYSPEVRERTVQLVFEHQAEHESQWVAICSIADKIGCTAETLRRWVRQASATLGCGIRKRLMRQRHAARLALAVSLYS